ncbi:hypothetical protein MAR_005970 [Mya arenaria]|uniref:Mutator-like transposase domain-containing protein n=1 Tax=Mya arenaria TaxID=6604 RepID=A0ABY7DAT9_MYAAR|nr:hypothetical protein MAR_005970 [Mya arenaria]
MVLQCIQSLCSQKCFSYGISQNKGNTHGLRTSLNALSAHMLNEHSSCSPTWCKSLSTRITGRRTYCRVLN